MNTTQKLIHSWKHESDEWNFREVITWSHKAYEELKKYQRIKEHHGEAQVPPPKGRV